jgi:hypothetical protein
MDCLRPFLISKKVTPRGMKMLAPGGDAKFPLNRALTSVEVAAYQSGVLEAYWGTTIWYEDIWNEKHSLSYCLWFNPNIDNWVSRTPDCKN